MNQTLKSRAAEAVERSQKDVFPRAGLPSQGGECPKAEIDTGEPAAHVEQDGIRHRQQSHAKGIRVGRKPDGPGESGGVRVRG